MALDGPEVSLTSRPVVLVVDDDAGLRRSIRLILDDRCEVLEAPDGVQARAIVRTVRVDLVLLDVRLPDVDGIALLGEIKALDGRVAVIVVTAVDTVRTAVLAMKLGALDYLTKPFDEEELLRLVSRALQERPLGAEVNGRWRADAGDRGFDELVGCSPAMQRLYDLVQSVARMPVTVLILGESGTGKELVARAIHRHGTAAGGPFVPVNVAAISDGLLESELFGHERGAFTGAIHRKPGKFELAHGGTLFLDEICTLRVELQAKILRVLQEREVERVGGTRRIQVDVRVVAATNVDPRRAVQSGALREDLYYRLNVVQINLPPLRERREDIPLLVEHFIAKYSRQFRKEVAGLAPPALELLQAYAWPGNVRELSNLVERSVALAAGPIIEAGDLPLDLLLGGPTGGPEAHDRLPLRKARDRFERKVILEVLELVRWNRSHAARLLGMHRNSLKAKLEGWGVRAAGDDR